jgi:Methyltransferase domain
MGYLLHGVAHRLGRPRGKARKRSRELFRRTPLPSWRKRGRKALRLSRKSLRRWRVRSARAAANRRDRLRLPRAGVEAPLAAFIGARPGDAIPPDYRDLWSLYTTVRRRKPKVLLEFGSGCSTLVLALALSRNGIGHLWSVDSEEKWAAATEPALIELRSLVTIVRSPIAEDDRDVPGFTHSRIPDLRPDFVYVDVSLPYETSLIRCCRYRDNPPTRLSDHDRRAEGHRSISEQAPEPPAHARASIRRLAPHRNTQLSA